MRFVDTHSLGFWSIFHTYSVTEFLPLFLSLIEGGRSFLFISFVIDFLNEQRSTIKNLTNGFEIEYTDAMGLWENELRNNMQVELCQSEPIFLTPTDTTYRTTYCLEKLHLLSSSNDLVIEKELSLDTETNIPFNTIINDIINTNQIKDAFFVKLYGKKKLNVY